MPYGIQAVIIRYLREESPCWAAGSTASEECWLDREELRLVCTDLEWSNELGYQRSACWRLISCGTNRTPLVRSSHHNISELTCHKNNHTTKELICLTTYVYFRNTRATDKGEIKHLIATAHCAALESRCNIFFCF